LHYLQQCYFIKARYKKDYIKLNYTSSQKQNVHSDQSSLSFRVGHCHRQLIGMNKYIYLITWQESKVQNRYKIKYTCYIIKTRKKYIN